MIRLSRQLVIVLLAAISAPVANADEVLLSEFNNSGFSYTYGGFNQASGATSTRLFDDEDGWGAGVVNASLDLSALADARVVIDLGVNPGHGANLFQFQLNDANGLSGRWTFPTGALDGGTTATLTSGRTLAEPNAVYDQNLGDFVDELPDLSQITNWTIEGEWDSPGPFDLSFDNVLISTDAQAPPPYPGYEPDAPWRAEAAARIDAHRKADLTVRVVDAAGTPVPNALVGVEQLRHEFGFGSAVQARRLRDEDPTHAEYKAHVEQLFNTAVLENNLKWPPWEGEWGSNFTQQGAENALAWLNEREIATRGHVMVWPGASNLPADLRAIFESGEPLSAAEQQLVRDRIAARIAEVGAFGEGKLVAWDVVNEPRANHDVMDALPEGDDAMITWFQQAAAAAPSAKLFLNEYNILASAGGTDTAEQQLLENQARALQEGGAPIDGVGLQGHFRDDTLTGPEALWDIVDRYADLGLEVQATEFDYTTDDEQLQAAYLRDFYTALFAHEGVSSVLMWGFWEDAHWRPEAALYRSDWSPKPAAEAYNDLVYNAWWTDEQAEAGADGEATVRAFKGEQGVTATFGGEQASGEATLSDGGATVTLELAMLLGDFNRDGAVDAADYTVWRDSVGQSVVAPGLGADGDGDGVIGPGDLAVWRWNYGATLAAPAAVPEPTTLGVTGTGAFLSGVGGRRRR